MSGEYANWVLHRQPADQVADHKFSIWSGEHPVILANEVPGEEGALAHIIDVLNGSQGRHCEPGHVLMPQSRDEAQAMYLVAEKYLFPEGVPAPAQSKQEHVDWAASRWTSEVANRPLQNVHRRSLDTTWRQVIRHFGGDDAALCGPTHDDLITEAPGYAGPDRNMPLEGYSVSSTGGGTAA